jgi:hypothetical protein
MTSTISGLLEKSYLLNLTTWNCENSGTNCREFPRTFTKHALLHAKKSITQSDHVMGITHFTAPSMQRGCRIR